MQQPPSHDDDGLPRALPVRRLAIVRAVRQQQGTRRRSARYGGVVMHGTQLPASVGGMRQRVHLPPQLPILHAQAGVSDPRRHQGDQGAVHVPQHLHGRADGVAVVRLQREGRHQPTRRWGQEVGRPASRCVGGRQPRRKGRFPECGVPRLTHRRQQSSRAPTVLLRRPPRHRRHHSMPHPQPRAQHLSQPLLHGCQRFGGRRGCVGREGPPPLTAIRRVPPARLHLQGGGGGGGGGPASSGSLTPPWSRPRSVPPPSPLSSITAHTGIEPTAARNPPSPPPRTPPPLHSRPPTRWLGPGR
jgi:hypothetical protein